MHSCKARPGANSWSSVSGADDCSGTAPPEGGCTSTRCRHWQQQQQQQMFTGVRRSPGSSSSSMIRGQLSGFAQLCMQGQAFSQCTACSASVLDQYYAKGCWGLMQQVEPG